MDAPNRKQRKTPGENIYRAFAKRSDPEAEANVGLLPDITQEQADFWRPKVSFLRDDRGFRKALTALKDKVQNGNAIIPLETAVELSEMLTFLVARAVTKRKIKIKREDWEDLWASETGGKTWKSLTEFPDRLRKMAMEVQKLNASPFFNPERAITSKKSTAIFAKRQFLLLPVTLRKYADWMEAWAKQIPILNSRYYPSAPRGHSRSVVHISTVAKLITGRYCDGQVSELLNVADVVLNPDDPHSGRRFHTQTLRDLRSRQKRKPSRT